MFKIKPWIALALQKSTSVEKCLFKKSINCNDSQTKEHLHTSHLVLLNHTSYSQFLSTLLKRSKRNYYNHYFDINSKNIKNTLKGVKSILSLKNNPSDITKI